MKRLLLLTAIVATTGFISKNLTSVYTHPATKDTIDFPYKATYSSSFEMDDPINAKSVLMVLKNWDNNTLDNSLADLSDSLELNFGKGTRWMGSKSDTWKRVKDMRDMYSKMETRVDAWMAFRTNRKNRVVHWVAVWSRQFFTDKNGQEDSTDLHEVWKLDKNNKVRLLSRYNAVLVPR